MAGYTPTIHAETVTRAPPLGDSLSGMAFAEQIRRWIMTGG
jgi:hypothetical protein